MSKKSLGIISSEEQPDLNIKQKVYIYPIPNITSALLILKINGVYFIIIK